MVLSGEGSHLARVESLLASVQELTHALGRRSAELEKEIAIALYQGGETTRLDQLELENARLRTALDDRAVIEQAKGVLIATRRCTPAQAMTTLTERAGQGKRSVREVAAELIDQARRPPVHASRPTEVSPKRKIDLGLVPLQPMPMPPPMPPSSR